ncbi:hypothetical protein [Clostridium hydrogeniformans]|uniref:hypothetical protein n=1 Tax=Clostridium hydrogeniformans TaxID=349933 RepID=UPI00048A140A|nr:hypothetical protein [Clostridium hydrogeniformans]
MKSSENILGKYSYLEPYSSTCKHQGPLGTIYDIPCIKERRREVEVFIKYYYPETSKEEEEMIHSCARKAGEEAWPTISGAIASGMSLIPGAIVIANEILRRDFKECLNKSNVSTKIKEESTIGIYRRRLGQ